MNQICMYMAPEAEKIQSYLITLLDGTASMNKEYESIVQAHEDVFGCLGKDQQLNFQWEGKMIEGKLQLFDFLPFRRGYKGNISGTFHTLFNILLNPINSFQRNITILFISDGEEPYDYDEIEHQIRLLKQKYEVQFISLAVGDGFPNTISNHLRKNLHNQNTSCPPIFKVARELNKVSLLYQDIRQEVDEKIRLQFVNIFEQIKQQLLVEKKIVLNVPVYEYLQSTQPTTVIAPSEPFLTKDQRVTIKIENKIIKETSNINTLLKLINNSVQHSIIEAVAEQKKDVNKQFEVIEDLSHKLLNQATEGIEQNEQQEMLSAQLELISSVTLGQLDFKNLKQSEATELQAASQSEAIYQALDSLSNDNIISCSLEQQTKKTKGKFTQIKAGCFIRSKSTKKQLDCVESIQQVILENISQQRKILEKQPQVNVNLVCRNTIDMIKQELESIFQKQKLKFNEHQLQILRNINQVLKILVSVASQEKVDLNDIYNAFDKCLEEEIQEEELQSENYNQLPQNLRKQIFEQMNIKEDKSAKNKLISIGCCIFLLLIPFL